MANRCDANVKSETQTPKATERAVLQLLRVGAVRRVVPVFLFGAIQGCDPGKGAIEELNSRLPSGCSAPDPASQALLKITCAESTSKPSEREQLEQNVKKLEETIKKVESALEPVCSKLAKAGLSQISVDTTLSYQSDKFTTYWEGNTEKCLLGGDHDNCTDGFSIDGDLCKSLHRK
jgi:hypothetical protein